MLEGAYRGFRARDSAVRFRRVLDAPPGGRAVHLE